MNSLDNILGGGEAVSENETVVEEVSQAVEAAVDQETKTSEVEEEGAEQGQTMVPKAALDEARGKVKRYTEQVASFEQTLKERDEAWERRFGQLLETVKPKPEPQQAPDQFDDFPGAARHALAGDFERVNQGVMAMAQMVAGLKYGDDKVSAADEAFGKAVKAGTIDQADYHKVLGSPNIYAAAVQWHQRQLAQAEIGDDPAAYKAKLEAELREKIAAEYQQGGQQQAQQPPARVMPNNIAGARNVGSRSGPAWSGPSPLDDIFNRSRASG